MSSYTAMPKRSTGTAAKVGVSMSVPFDKMAAELADKQNAARAAASAAASADDYTTILPVNSQDVIAAAFEKSPGGPVPTTGLMPSNGWPNGWQPSTVGGHSYDPNPKDYFTNPPAVPDFFTKAGSKPNYDWPASHAPLPAELTGLKIPLGYETKLIQPKLTAAAFAAKAKDAFLNDLSTGGNSHRRSALKAKRSRRSASRKRCRRKGKRSRKAHS